MKTENSNLNFRIYKDKDIYREIYRNNKNQILLLLKKKYSEESTRKDLYKICLAFQSYIFQILFEKKNSNYRLIQKNWEKNFQNIISNNKKNELIESHKSNLIKELKVLSKKFSLPYHNYNSFSEKLLMNIHYPIEVDKETLTKRLRILKKIQRDELKITDLFSEFDALEKFQAKILELNYLRALDYPNKSFNQKIQIKNPYPKIFIDGEAYFVFRKILLNRYHLFNKPGPALYSKLFHLFVDENMIYPNSNKQAYLRLIVNEFNTQFSQFDVRAMYSETELRIFNKAKRMNLHEYSKKLNKNLVF